MIPLKVNSKEYSYSQSDFKLLGYFAKNELYSGLSHIKKVLHKPSRTCMVVKELKVQSSDLYGLDQDFLIDFQESNNQRTCKNNSNEITSLLILSYNSSSDSNTSHSTDPNAVDFIVRLYGINKTDIAYELYLECMDFSLRDLCDEIYFIRMRSSTNFDQNKKLLIEYLFGK